ncbi:MAG TPA: cellulose binding domain-containing protein, partial [Pilimelia sp.]|nr:cellulose binding domain-containing protein [Pilimelia sp.]
MRKFKLIAAVGLAGAVAGAVALTALPASAETATFTVVNSWGSGYQGNVTVRNDTSAAISSWQVQLTLPAGTTIGSSWNAVRTNSGSTYTFRNESWNGNLAAGASTSFGFTATGSGTPISCSVNGRACTGGTTPTGGPSPTGGPPPTRAAPTPTRPAGPPPPPPPGATPVARVGQLRVCGTRMCASNGSQVQLRGVSSMWLNWESRGYAENLSALTWMRDNWGLTVIRAAMGVEPAGAYLSDPARARGQVERIINNAVAAGVYVIV